jgi:hypothetical protein
VFQSKRRHRVFRDLPPAFVRFCVALRPKEHGWGRRLTSIKAAASPIADSAPLFEGRRSMTTETVLIVGAITAAFALFALTLWRAERMTRDLKR